MKIYVMPNLSKDLGLRYTKEVLSELLSDKNGGAGEVCISPETAAGLHCDIAARCTVARLCDVRPELIIVLGGDGSIMRASHYAAEISAPLLGINLGKVGYLAELETSEIPLLSDIFSGAYTVEERMMLKVEHLRGGKQVSEPLSALNDAAIAHGIVTKLTKLDLYCNGTISCSYRSDGIVVSTPTGSTAYSLSAGGPVIDPELSGICVTPVCSHSLWARPVIFSDKSVIEIINRCERGGDLNLTVDGGDTVQLEPDDVIRITKSSSKTKLLRFNKHDNRSFYRVLYKKMSEI